VDRETIARNGEPPTACSDVIAQIKQISPLASSININLLVRH